MKKILIVLFLSFLLIGCGNTDYSKAVSNIKKSNYFTNNEELTKEDVEYRYDIDTTNFSDMFVYYYITKDSANTIFIIKPINNDGINSYESLIKTYENEWLSIVYDEKQANKVNNALNTKTSNGYYIYIVSDNNESVYDLIKENL